MMTLILFGFFFVLVILNVPIGVSLGLAASIGLIYADFPLSVIPGIMYSGTGKFALWLFLSLSWPALSWTTLLFPNV